MVSKKDPDRQGLLHWLTLAPLWSSSGAVETVLFALFFPRIAAQKPGALESLAEVLVKQHQGARKPVADEDGRLLRTEDFTRFVFTHDVGSAIRGPVRVDLFWGSGVRASAEAHRMRHPGRLYVFVLR